MYYKRIWKANRYLFNTWYLYTIRFNSFTIFVADINECLNSPCPMNSVCNNLKGSYGCSCRAGYQDFGGDCIGIL